MSNPAESPVAAAPSVGEPQARVGKGFLTVYGLVNFGLYLIVMMPALFSLPYKVQLLAPDNKAVALGIITSIGAVVTIIATPLAGVLSDRTRTRWGRRRPWLVGGILVVAAGSAVVALAPSIPVALVGWIIVCLGGAGPTVAITPVVAEQIPEEQRGLVGGIIGVATQLAGVLGYTIGGSLAFDVLVLFLAPVIVLAALALLYLLFIPDPIREVPPTTVRETFRLMVFDPRKHPDFAWVWVGKFLMQFALAFLTTFQLYFVADRLGFSPEEAGQRLALVGGIGILVTMTFAVVSGLLSDRVRRRKPFIWTAAGLAAVGLGLTAVTDGFGVFFAAVLFILGAAGMFGSVDVAMASDLVPDRAQSGRWMAIYNLAASLPSALAPLLGSALLSIGSPTGGNYLALFLGGAVIAIGTGIATVFIRGVR